MRKYKKSMLSLLTLYTLSSSISYADGVEYKNTQNVEQMTLNFGSTDLNMIAEKMLISLLQKSMFNSKKRPIIVLSHIKNKTNETIDTKSITDKIKVALIKSERVQVSVLNEIGNELKNQSTKYTNKMSAKQIGKQIGADYTLYGEITSIEKNDGKNIEIYYKITLNLVNIESGIAEWAEEKEIKKIGAKELFTTKNSSNVDNKVNSIVTEIMNHPERVHQLQLLAQQIVYINQPAKVEITSPLDGYLTLIDFDLKSQRMSNLYHNIPIVKNIPKAFPDVVGDMVGTSHLLAVVTPSPMGNIESLMDSKLFQIGYTRSLRVRDKTKSIANYGAGYMEIVVK